MNIGNALYKDVPALSTDTVEQVIPNEEIWEVQMFAGNAAYLDDVVVALIWDYGGAGETILAATHGDIVLRAIHRLTGDGTKKLALVLDNATPASRVIGAAWTGVKS